MVAKKRWTEMEEKILISHIKENPDNLKLAFIEASNELNRSIPSVIQKWYCGKNSLKNRCGKVFMTCSSRKASINSKVCTNTNNLSFSCRLRKVLKILFS